MTWNEDAVRQRIADVVAETERALRDDGTWPSHVEDQEPGDPGPWTGVYLGSAGIAWALHRLGSHVDVVGAALERYRAEPELGEWAEPRSLLAGEAGILLVARVLGASAYDEERLRTLVADNARSPAWELLLGSTGSLVIALACGFDDLYDELAPILADAAGEDGLWTQDIFGSTARYLGPAHGFAANVHVLRRHLGDDELRRRALPVLERFAHVEDGLVNWPPVADGDPKYDRVQWCHGAPGIICTLGDLLPEQLLLGAAELVWQRGPLEKGPGLCHGTAGNGYALLRTNELTGDNVWLDRARSFALHALEHTQSRYSLFTGDIGAALFAQACIDIDARFPIVDVV